MASRHSAFGMFLLILSVVSASASPSRAQSTYKPEAGLFAVEVLDETWRDASRSREPLAVEPGDAPGREIPVRVYLPTSAAAAVGPRAKAGSGAMFPVVVFSHGMGGSRDGYEYIGRHLASHGYLVIHPQHPGSDKDAILKAGKDKITGKATKDETTPDAKQTRPPAKRRSAGMLAEITDQNTSDPANLENRPKDISFVLDQVSKHARLSKLADMTRVAVAGHSFGSYTTMAICGMVVDLPGRPDTSFRDERVKVGIAMSPQGVGVMGVNAGAWDRIPAPMLVATGTKDMGQGERAVEWRHEPFTRLSLADAYFLNITGANHMTFSGGSVRDRFGSTKQEHLSMIRQTCTAFLDAYLLGDAPAKKWLVDRSIEAASDHGCELTCKQVAEQKPSK